MTATPEQVEHYEQMAREAAGLPKRVLVCGGRDYHDATTMEQVLSSFLEQGDCVIHGGARGADALAGDIAGRVLGYPVHVFPADWHQYGKAAGPIRNKQMLDEGKPTLVLAFPGGRGTQNMIDQARTAGISVVEL